MLKLIINIQRVLENHVVFERTGNPVEDTIFMVNRSHVSFDDWVAWEDFVEKCDQMFFF